MKTLKLSAFILAAVLFMGLGATTVSADSKACPCACNGKNMQAMQSGSRKCGDMKNGSGKCGDMKNGSGKCGDMKDKKDMKCGAGKCGDMK